MRENLRGQRSRIRFGHERQIDDAPQVANRIDQRLRFGRRRASRPSRITRRQRLEPARVFTKSGVQSQAKGVVPSSTRPPSRRDARRFNERPCRTSGYHPTTGGCPLLRTARAAARIIAWATPRSVRDALRTPTRWVIVSAPGHGALGDFANFITSRSARESRCRSGM